MKTGLDETFLSDDFCLRGENQEEFEELLREIDSCTEFIKCSLRDLELFGTLRKKQSKNFLYLLLPRNLEEPGGEEEDKDEGDGAADEPVFLKKMNLEFHYLKFPKSRFLRRGNFSNLLEEACKTTGLFFFCNNQEENESSLNGTGDTGEKLCFCSERALKTLAQRAGSTLSSIKENCLERDLYLARLMDRNKETTIVVKEFQGVKKAFAFMSKEYKEVELLEVCDLYSPVNEKKEEKEKRLGKMECESWEITHERVSIRFCFPDFGLKAKKQYGLKEVLTPYVEYTDSDTGEASLQVKLYWKTADGSVIPFCKYVKEHKGSEFDIDKIYEKIERAIYDRFEELPRRLSGLRSIRISPENFTPKSAYGAGKNRAAVFAALKYMMKYTKTAESIGKKREIRLKRIYDLERIDETMEYTAEDVLLLFARGSEFFMKSPGKEKPMTDEGLRKFRENSVCQAVGLDFEAVRAYAKKDAESG